MTLSAVCLLFLGGSAIALLAQLAVLNAIDRHKFSAASRAALAKRRTEIEAENIKAENDAHVAAIVDCCESKWGRKP